jgi:8-oxo-dGTP pyrophosphatase MutT (NUDIX family)
LVEESRRILLVRVRDNALWYLPGGTIEFGESAQDALVREIAEELGVEIDICSLTQANRIIGPAYGREGTVELNCFTASWRGTINAQAEITELGWFGPEDRDQVAPAIRLLFDELWSEVA